MATSRGLPWAIGMALLMLLECLVLAEVLLFDRANRHGESGGSAVTIYFWAACGTMVLQFVGIALVLSGRVFLGGTLQIIASAPHVIKIEGILGVVGGLRARAHARRLAAEAPGTAAGV